jgi:hypothetical protein
MDSNYLRRKREDVPMCECCGGDCRLCSPNPGFIEFPEVIDSMIVENNCMVINGKFKLIPTQNPDSPFRIEEMKQPLNEAYKNDILEAYQKISDTFDDFTKLMRSRVPYEEWPKHCQIAGINPDLLGPADIGCSPPGTKIKGFDKPPEMVPIPDTHVAYCNEMKDISKITAKQMEECIKDGWKHVQSTCRPDKSFRAMLRIMIHWMAYMEKQKTATYPLTSRIEDIGRAQERLRNILDDDIFHKSAFDPLRVSENAQFDHKSDFLREKISCLHDNLWDLMAILMKEEER